MKSLLLSILDYFKLKHYHYYETFVISRYLNFHEREVIYECRCGKRIIKRKRVEDIFPYPTASNISKKDFDLFLTNGKYPTIAPIGDGYYVCHYTTLSDTKPTL